MTAAPEATLDDDVELCSDILRGGMVGRSSSPNPVDTELEVEGRLLELL